MATKFACSFFLKFYMICFFRFSTYRYLRFSISTKRDLYCAPRSTESQAVATDVVLFFGNGKPYLFISLFCRSVMVIDVALFVGWISFLI